MVAASVILYQRVEKFSYILSCSKQDVYTFLFYFLRLSFSCSSHSLRLLGIQHQLTHPPLKNSSLPLRKIPIFQGVAPWHTILTLSCVISFWDSATAHSSSGKELILSSLEESRFWRIVVLLMFSYYPACALFVLVLTHFTH